MIHLSTKDQVWRDDLEEFTLHYINKLDNTLGKTVKYLSVPSSVYLSSTAYLASVCSGSKLNVEFQTSHSISTPPASPYGSKYVPTLDRIYTPSVKWWVYPWVSCGVGLTERDLFPNRIPELPQRHSIKWVAASFYSGRPKALPSGSALSSSQQSDTTPTLRLMPHNDWHSPSFQPCINKTPESLSRPQSFGLYKHYPAMWWVAQWDLAAKQKMDPHLASDKC